MTLPIAIIGAGPVGLAAAAQLLERGLEPIIFEQGPQAGHAVAQWAHVRIFSTWDMNVDQAAKRLLAPAGWQMPDPDAVPTGGELLRGYLIPLASHPQIASRLRLMSTVTGITRRGHDKVSTGTRDQEPFVLRFKGPGGDPGRVLVSAVIDATGTWFSPNPLGADGFPVEGEAEAAKAGLLAYGIPDVAGTARDQYQGKTILVAGSGHSATNVIVDLMALARAHPGTKIIWAMRRGRLDRLQGGGLNDRLPARGALGLAAADAARSGLVQVRTGFAAQALRLDGGRIGIEAEEDGAPVHLTVDRIIVAAGFRPDFTMTRELRLGLDTKVETTPDMAPLIDPNFHSCGTVRPHGAAELAHPETGFYIAGMKSYGRAPTFLMATGYEQVRSIAAKLAGDEEAARRVELVLPETGVCSGPRPKTAEQAAPEAATAPATGGGCCGPNANPNASARVGAQAG